MDDNTQTTPVTGDDDTVVNGGVTTDEGVVEGTDEVTTPGAPVTGMGEEPAVDSEDAPVEGATEGEEKKEGEDTAEDNAPAA